MLYSLGCLLAAGMPVSGSGTERFGDEDDDEECPSAAAGAFLDPDEWLTLPKS